MVPIKEMTDVMRVVKETAHLKPKQWVRLRRTVFRDDIAQIDYVESAQSTVSLKLIPRIDYSRKRGVFKHDNVRRYSQCCIKYSVLRVRSVYVHVHVYVCIENFLPCKPCGVNIFGSARKYDIER